MLASVRRRPRAQNRGPIVRGSSDVIVQLDSMALEGLEHRLQACLEESPSARRAGMDGLPNLHSTGCSYDPRVRMKFETGWIPLETDEVDQETCVLFQVCDQLFV